MLTALTLCWIIQVMRLCIRMNIGFGQSSCSHPSFIANLVYGIYLLLVIWMVLSRVFLLWIVPHGTPEGESPELVKQFGTPWFLREGDVMSPCIGVWIKGEGGCDLGTSKFSFGFVYSLDQTIKLSQVCILLLLPFTVFQLLSHASAA